VRLDVWAYVIGGFGGLILAFAGAHGFQNKSVTIIGFGVGAILVVIAGCLYWQDAIWKQDSMPIDSKERPYVFVGNTDLEPLTSGEVAVFHYRVKNTGPVEAIGEIAGWTSLCVDSSVTELPPYHPKNARHGFRLAPTEWINGHFRSEIIFSQEQINAVNSGEARFFIYAKVNYWASDQQERKYTLPICFMYDRNAAGSMSFCPDNITVQKESK
jgi:hypothetical protein